MANINHNYVALRYIMVLAIVIHCLATVGCVGNRINSDTDCIQSLENKFSDYTQVMVVPCKRVQRSGTLADVYKYMEECLKSSDGIRYKKNDDPFQITDDLVKHVMRRRRYDKRLENTLMNVIKGPKIIKC